MRKKHREIEKPFYENAYNNPETRLARGFGWDIKPSPSMIQLFEKHVRSSKNIRVLDIGIGADGRNTQYFLNLGFHVTGVDISTNAIDNCSKKLAQHQPNLNLIETDISVPNTVINHNSFDIIIDWSVMDHIRREYLSAYKRNIFDFLKSGGYLISSQFANPLPEKFKLYKGKDYYLWKGHYMRAFKPNEIIAEFPKLQLIDQIDNCPEDAINGILIHTMLFRKP